MSRDASTSSRKSEKDKHHREMFGLFRKRKYFATSTPNNS
jgi:hypothetical protein